MQIFALWARSPSDRFTYRRECDIEVNGVRVASDLSFVGVQGGYGGQPGSGAYLQYDVTSSARSQIVVEIVKTQWDDPQLDRRWPRRDPVQGGV